MGQIGKLKQKYQKSKSTKVQVKSNSCDQLAETTSNNPRHLKRRYSERQGKMRKVAFEDQKSIPWWNYPLRFMKGVHGTTTGHGGNKKRTRRRHFTDPDMRSMTYLYIDITGDLIDFNDYKSLVIFSN